MTHRNIAAIPRFGSKIGFLTSDLNTYSRKLSVPRFRKRALS